MRKNCSWCCYYAFAASIKSKGVCYKNPKDPKHSFDANICADFKTNIPEENLELSSDKI